MDVKIVLQMIITNLFNKKLIFLISDKSTVINIILTMIKTVIIIFLCLYFVASYDTGVCQVVGFQISYQQKFTNRYQTDAYYPYLNVNLYFNESIYLYNNLLPVARIYQNLGYSYVLTKEDAENWQSNYQLGQNYTCYFDNINNVYMDLTYTYPSTLTVILIIIIAFLIVSSLCTFLICLSVHSNK